MQRDILRTVRNFVDAEVLPVAAELDRTDTYPDKIVERLKELGVFGLTISERYGGLDVLTSPWSWRSCPVDG